MKYHKQESELSSSYVKATDIVKFIKWARSWEIICLDVSKDQIFQGLFGNSQCLFKIRTENDKIPKDIWTIIPTNPTTEQC